MADDPKKVETTATDPARTRRSSASLLNAVRFAAGDLVAGRYRIKNLIAHGGMGDVYEATDNDLRTDIALKTIRGSSSGQRVERFRREIFLARKVTHPNVCRVFDLGRHALPGGEEVMFITMELLRGETLAHRLKARGKMTTGEALGLIKQIVAAIEAAHAAGVVHRDLKPGNVMLVDGDGTPRVRAIVTDFGVAHAAGDPFEEISGTGDIVGSPAYMAPEQIEGLETTPRADIYALGIVIYEMVTGIRPFQGETSISAAVKRLKVDPPPPTTYEPDLSPVWTAVIMRCLQREPVARFASVSDVVDALTGGPTAQVPKFDSIGVADTALDMTARRRRKLLPYALAAGGVLALAGGVMFVLGLRGAHEAAPAPSRPAGGSAVPAPAVPTNVSIAVLPFADTSPARDQAYFADGLTDELIALVGKLPHVQVVGRTSAFAFKDTRDDAAAIGKKLGVTKLLEGSVAKIGDRVRITARLVNAADGFQLWSESYDRQNADLFAMQDEISAAVARSLAVELSPTKTAAGERTVNPEAHNQVLLGRNYVIRDQPEDYERAAAAFQKAIDLDPTYAAAYAGLALAERSRRDYATSPAQLEELMRHALELGDKALALGPDVAEVRATRGYLFFNLTWDFAAARAELQRALELDPANPETLRMYGGLLDLLGEPMQALDMMKKAVAADPLSARAWNNLGSQQIAVGQRTEARASLEKSRELDPASRFALNRLATLDVLEGNLAAAQAATGEFDGILKWGLIALIEHSLGHKDKSDAAIAKLIKDDAHTAGYQIATAYAWRGELDKAFEWLEHSIEDRDAGLTEIRSDPMLANVRADPRYQGILKKLKLVP